MSQRDDEPMSDAPSEREDEKMAPSSPKSAAPQEKTKPKRSPRKEPSSEERGAAARRGATGRCGPAAFAMSL